MKPIFRHNILPLILATFACQNICAYNQVHDFYQRLVDTITYQKELTAATVALAYLAYISPAMDFSKQLTGGAIATYFAAKMLTPNRQTLEGLVTIAAHESGYNEVNYSYPNESHKQLKKNIMLESLHNFAKQTNNVELKNEIEAFTDTIDELTNIRNILQRNPGITQEEINRHISFGFHILDDLVAHPSKIAENMTFRINLTTIKTTLKELIILAASDIRYYQRRAADPQAHNILEIQHDLIQDMKNKAIKDFQMRDVLAFEATLEQLLKQRDISSLITNEDPTILKQVWANTLDYFVNNPEAIKDNSIFQEKQEAAKRIILDQFFADPSKIQQKIDATLAKEKPALKRKSANPEGCTIL